MHEKIKTINLENILSSGQIIHIANKMLSELNVDLVEHNKRTAYIAFLISQNLKLLENFSQTNLVVLSLFHTIGFFRPDVIQNFYSLQTIDDQSKLEEIREVYVFSSYYLQYMTPLKYDAAALVNFDKDFVPGESFVYRSAAYREIIYFASKISLFLANNPNANLPDDLNEIAPNKFNPMVINAFKKVNKDNFIINKINTKEYDSYLSNIINTFHFRYESNQKVQKILVYFLDLKSTATFKHAINTACFAISLGIRMNLSDEELQILFTSAILHDVGKISIPTRLLEFPGKLTKEQFEQMKQHVLYSKLIIQDYVPAEVVDAVYRHHEKLNGTGYPNKLTAADLTLVQRLITVADILSALLDSRSYKNEYSKEDTFKILATMTFDGEIDPCMTEFIITDFDEIIEELAYLQEDFKVNYNVVITKINDYIYTRKFASLAQKVDLSSTDYVDDLEELEELEVLEEA